MTTAATTRPAAPDSDPSPQRTRTRVPAVAALTAVVPAALVATVVLPGAAGLGGHWPWVGLVAFRGLVGVLLLGAAVPPLVVALVGRRHRRIRASALTVVAVLVLGVVGEAAVVAVRGPLPVQPGGPVPGDAITVVVTNTEHSGADPTALVDLFSRTHADVVAMPETDRTLADLVAGRLGGRGDRFQVFSVPAQGSITPTALLVSTRLGTYRQTGDTGLARGEVLAEPVGGAVGRPVLIAVHPQAPVGSRQTAVWAVGTSGAVDACSARPDAVLAGDFNATVDSPALRRPVGCADVARRLRASAVATWPQDLPRVFGAPLDHVLATRSSWRPVAVWAAPQPGSDHRALVTRLVRTADGPPVGDWARG